MVFVKLIAIIYNIYIMDIKAIDLNLLTVFEAIWLERNVTRAAKRLGLTQSATSSALQRLREATGDALLVRTLDGMVPTARAVVLSEPIHEALKLIRKALLPQPEFDPATSQQLFTMIATDYVQAAVLPKLQMHLAVVAPKVNLVVKPPTGDIPVRALESGEVDLVFAPFESNHMGIYRRTLFKETYVCVTRKNHPVIHGSISLRQFAEAQHILVSFKGERRSNVDDILAKQSLERRVAIVVPYFQMALDMLNHSDLVMTCPRRLVSRGVSLQVLDLPIDLPGFSIHQYWHERSHGSDAHAWFRKQIELIADNVT